MSEEKENVDEKNEISKAGFFTKVWNSIVKIEKYPDMAAEGLGRAFAYLCKIVAILAIVLCIGMMYQTHKMLKEGIEYIQNEFPDFSYQDGVLNVLSEQRITISESDSYIGRTIIDTNTEDEQTINEYITELEQSGSGIIILKDKVVLKNSTVAGTINYNYSELLGQMGIDEFTKQSVIDYVNSTKVISLYASIFITIFVYSFIMYLLTTLSNAVFLSAFGYLTTWIARIKMRFVAVFNMAIYSLTLSVFLNMIYIAVNIFINFNMEYFQVMYVSVAAIYLVAAIFLLKIEFIKRQTELMKIAEAQEIVKKEMEEKEQKEKQEKKEREKKDKEENEKKDTKKDDNNIGDDEEPEGSNA
jgi:Sec-independent protein translocase protein TatA